MTPRQIQILDSIVELYASSAEPVGSVALSKLLNFSPATIRAEMAALEDAGYIAQPYTSAGRVPTDQGYRLYVNRLRDVPETDRRTTGAIERRIAAAGPGERAVRAAAESLAEVTGNLGVATLPDNLVRIGLASLLSHPEFYLHTNAYELARLVDNLESWFAEAEPAAGVSVYIGAENPVGRSSGCSLIVARYRSPYSDTSYIGILGPTRQSYGRVMTLVGETGRILEEYLDD